MTYEKFTKLMEEKPEGYPVYILKSSKVIKGKMTCFKLKHGSTKNFSGYSSEIYVRETPFNWGEWIDCNKIFLSKEELIKKL